MYEARRYGNVHSLQHDNLKDIKEVDSMIINKKEKINNEDLLKKRYEELTREKEDEARNDKRDMIKRFLNLPTNYKDGMTVTTLDEKFISFITNSIKETSLKATRKNDKKFIDKKNDKKFIDNIKTLTYDGEDVYFLIPTHSLVFDDDICNVKRFNDLYRRISEFVDDYYRDEISNMNGRIDKLCGKCHTSNVINAVYCNYCGGKLES